MIYVTRNVNWKRSLFECSSTKRSEKFEVVSGERYQHELVKLSKSKDAVVNVKKWRVVNPAAATTATCHKQQTCWRNDGTDEV
jgi:hypothetical protein